MPPSCPPRPHQLGRRIAARSVGHTHMHIMHAVLICRCGLLCLAQASVPAFGPCTRHCERGEVAVQARPLLPEQGRRGGGCPMRIQRDPTAAWTQHGSACPSTRCRSCPRPAPMPLRHSVGPTSHSMPHPQCICPNPSSLPTPTGNCLAAFSHHHRPGERRSAYRDDPNGPCLCLSLPAAWTGVP